MPKFKLNTAHIIVLPFFLSGTIPAIIQSFPITTPQYRQPQRLLFQNNQNSNHLFTKNKRSTKKAQQFATGTSSRHDPKCQPCPPPEDNPDMDRREAAFAMIGSLWSMGIISSSLLSSSPDVANAAFGEDAKMTIPNFVEGMTDRIEKQCLVETLGNRECLVYLDPENQLYQGADNTVLLQRMEKATLALESIPDLVEKKKWTAITGVLIGPMGELSGTMKELGKLTSEDSRKKKLGDIAKAVKGDINAMAAAADRKDGGKILEWQAKATDHLVEFVAAL
mmetsp:Transcript_29067/g.35403  ORF Transcript_29067/g.35403 Transcript_29067/m.35403 type:complete len:280 (+) Transcript_29067:42-881(+)